MAETELLFWTEAHATFIQWVNQSRNLEVTSLPTIPGRWSFTDGSLKDQDDYSGQGWYNTLESFDGLMGAKNTRASLYHPFMRKRKSSYGQWNVWEITIVSCHIFNGLLSIGEDSSGTRRMICLSKLFGRYQYSQRKFQSLKTHRSRTLKKMAANLPRSAHKPLSFIVNMEAKLPVWFAES